MFKKFSKESVSTVNQLRSSAARVVKSEIYERYGQYKEDLDALIPKKHPMYLVKCHDHISLYVCKNRALFFEYGKEKKIVPLLRTIHMFPDILPKFQVDVGAIKFILRGANVMSPGLVSSGGRMDEVEAGQLVSLYAEGKENALGVGMAMFSTEDIRKSDGGIVVEVLHVLGDGLWDYDPRIG